MFCLCILTLYQFNSQPTHDHSNHYYYYFNNDNKTSEILNCSSKLISIIFLGRITYFCKMICGKFGLEKIKLDISWLVGNTEMEKKKWIKCWVDFGCKCMKCLQKWAKTTIEKLHEISILKASDSSNSMNCPSIVIKAKKRGKNQRVYIWKWEIIMCYYS